MARLGLAQQVVGPSPSAKPHPRCDPLIEALSGFRALAALRPRLLGRLADIRDLLEAPLGRQLP
jgi:hypothetical protein